ncbi:MAG: VanW family protein [bacterium]|jgi:vancomycin resistance protein YoaR
MPFLPPALTRKIPAGPLRQFSFFLLFTLVVFYTVIVASASTRLRYQLHIGNVDVGYLTPEQAVRRLSRVYAPAAGLPLTLTYEGGMVSAPPSALGLRIDYERAVAAAFAVTQEKRWNILFRPVALPLPVTVDHSVFRRFMQPIAAACETEPRDAVAIIAGDTWTIAPANDGRGIAYNALAASLQSAVLAPAGRTVSIPLLTLPPRVTAEELAARGARSILSKFRTYFNEKDVNRSSNIRVSCEALVAYWVEPGGVFSYNAVTDRSANIHRYKEAKVYEQGRVVSGVGGGVCQVSSTLYNAALLAGLEITERHPHSLTVPYIAPGRDATVSDGVADLKFKNNTGHYLLIAVTAENGTLTARFFGQAAEPQEIIIRTAVVREIPPPVHSIKDTNLAEGEQKTVQAGKKGCQVKTWRIIKKDGKEISRALLSVDTYQPLEAVVRVGTRPTGADVKPAG